MTNPNLDLRIRTKEFALRIIRLFQALPKTGEAQVLGKQVLRSGTSIGTQYREARRAKSGRNFISKNGRRPARARRNRNLAGITR